MFFPFSKILGFFALPSNLLVTLGLLGASLGIPAAIAWCAVALAAGTLVVGAYSRIGRRPRGRLLGGPSRSSAG